MIIVISTTPNHEQGLELAERIVEARLAACVQLLPPMTSVYSWKGEMHKESEHLLLIKTQTEKWDELRDFIVRNHSYATPEILAIESAEISPKYEKWLNDSLSQG